MSICKFDSMLTSGEIARTRAKLTVAGDRLNCNPEEFHHMREELLKTILKYMDFEEEIFGIKMDIIYNSNRGIQDVKTIQIK